MKLSEPSSKCGNCGLPLICCPATIRRFVRCCDSCTHRTKVDETYETDHPAHKDYFG